METLIHCGVTALLCGAMGTVTAGGRGNASGRHIASAPVVASSLDPDVAARAGTLDVPLVLWTHPDFPAGLNLGATNGVSFGDYDADGFIDILALQAGRLWRNQAGETWELAVDIAALLPFATNRYGGHFGDYDNDGLPDIAAAGRLAHQAKGGSDFAGHLLRNLGDGMFVNVADDPAIMDQQPWGDQETLCWGDVDGDADLDLFVPVYPSWLYPPDPPYIGPGNFFYSNLGPVGRGGAYVFAESSAEVGVDNVVGVQRPEGAQFVDVDSDGDMDLYSNGLVYQNRSSFGQPDFAPMISGSGIGYANILEEGAVFADYDLDGDYDLLVAYASLAPVGIRIWENRGDGTFFGVESGVVQSPFIGLDLGISAEDWDNDGDIDFTTKQIFRRNMLVETGERSFIVGSHAVEPAHITSATPAWGDWDKDGDLDAAIGNWFATGHFYDNRLYDATTPMSERRYVRVRPVRDSADVPRGLETEYAASVEIDVVNDDRGLRRKKFTASAAGYLNQNEYTLHFGLEGAVSGGEPRFDVVVDFPSLPSIGTWRVDKHVNPVLGDIELAELSHREIVVFRSGVVRLEGETYVPSGSETPLLTTAAGGLVMPAPTSTLSAPTQAPENAFAGVDFDTIGARSPVRIREIIIDGTLAEPVRCGARAGTIMLWDITDPGAPAVLSDHVMAVNTPARNHRSHIRTDWRLEVDRRYRMVAAVESFRATAIDGPVADEHLTVNGGLGFTSSSVCTGEAVSNVAVDPTRLYVSFRYGPVAAPCVGDLDQLGSVGFSDLTELLDAWGETTSAANLDGFGSVGLSDLLILLQDWGPCADHVG